MSTLPYAFMAGRWTTLYFTTFYISLIPITPFDFYAKATRDNSYGLINWGNNLLETSNDNGSQI
jgi:hypothetical protein